MGGHRQKARCAMNKLTSKKARRLARKGERLLIKAHAIEMAATEDISPKYYARTCARFAAEDIKRAVDSLRFVRL